ncbi:MAG: hypothetical protein ABW277_21160 [Longimicrobiaceae bacterium]
MSSTPMAATLAGTPAGGARARLAAAAFAAVLLPLRTARVSAPGGP